MGGRAGGRRAALRTIVVAVVPAADRLDPDGWREVLDIAEGSISSRPPRLRRQIALFLRALDALAVVRWGRRLRSLEPDRARRLLAWLERSPLLLLRRGVWGVRTLAFMGYYGRRAAASELGYRAEAGGWSRRGGGEGAWATRSGAAPPEAEVSRMIGDQVDDA